MLVLKTTGRFKKDLKRAAKQGNKKFSLAL
jgi:mRNA-degrading endonuclease YafQ of YafQ-DinJ toxin-antitoxin module